MYRLIPSNCIVKRNGEAVMGAGLAKVAAEKYPELPKKLGRHISIFGSHIFVWPKEKIICLPTKKHWKDKSSISLINEGLAELALLMDMNLINEVALPRIGCGLGGLDWESQVEPIVDKYFAELALVKVEWLSI